MLADLLPAMNRLLERREATADEMRQAVLAVMEGRCSEAEIAALLTALAIKGEAVGELVGAARAMRAHATPIPVPASCGQLLDTCGTGGDNLHTFNISTAAAFVVAAAGIPVAKHGNRSVSSSSGSADVLEALGVNLQLAPERVAACVEQVGIGFCFAPLLHGAMKHAAPVRRQLGFRTIFNLLGPLTNPAGARYQLVGTGRVAVAEKLAGALALLGRERATVVCGADQLDEVSLWGETAVFHVADGRVSRGTWRAATFGLPECRVEELTVRSPTESASVIRNAFAGEPGPARDIIVANAAAALLTVLRDTEPEVAADLAGELIDEGRVARLVEKLVEFTNRPGDLTGMG